MLLLVRKANRYQAAVLVDLSQDEFERVVSNRRAMERDESEEEMDYSMTVMNCLFAVRNRSLRSYPQNPL